MQNINHCEELLGLRNRNKNLSGRKDKYNKNENHEKDSRNDYKVYISCDSQWPTVPYEIG